MLFPSDQAPVHLPLQSAVNIDYSKHEREDTPTDCSPPVSLHIIRVKNGGLHYAAIVQNRLTCQYPQYSLDHEVRYTIREIKDGIRPERLIALTTIECEKQPPMGASEEIRHTNDQSIS